MKTSRIVTIAALAAVLILVVGLATACGPTPTPTAAPKPAEPTKAPAPSPPRPRLRRPPRPRYRAAPTAARQTDSSARCRRWPRSASSRSLATRPTPTRSRRAFPTSPTRRSAPPSPRGPVHDGPQQRPDQRPGSGAGRQWLTQEQRHGNLHAESSPLPPRPPSPTPRTWSASSLPTCPAPTSSASP